MNNSEASVFEREIGLAPINAHLRAERLERRVGRGRQIVARQRDLVEKFGEQVPIAVALLETYETTLALFEENLAACKRDGVLVAGAEQAVHNSKALLAASTPNFLEPADASGLKQDYQSKACEVRHIMEILREGGYDCQLAPEILH